MQLFYPEQTSVLQAEMLVKWKQDRGLYNFKSLPQLAIICVDHSICKHLKSIFSKKIKGVKGNNFVSNNILFCTDFDNGGAGITTILEELRALGVQRFIFIGFAGKLSASIDEKEVYAIENAISAIGVTNYYGDSIDYFAHDQSFYNQVLQQLNCPTANCISVDAPFRETRSLINEAIAKDAQLIEMECAAVYAFGTFYQIPTICFLIATDSLMDIWEAPKDWQGVTKRMKQFIDKIVTIV